MIELYLTIMVIGLLFSAFFSASEVAYFSLKNSEEIKKDKRYLRSDNLIQKMINQPERLLTTILLCNTFSNIAVSISAAAIVSHIVSSSFLSETLIFTLEIITVTFVILVVSEITPKIVAISRPLKFSRLISIYMYVLFVLLKPITVIASRIMLRINKSVSFKEENIEPNEVINVTSMQDKEGLLHTTEKKYIKNLRTFNDTTVREVMTTRLDIKAISIKDKFGDLKIKINTHNFTRFPLYDKDLDDIIGIINIKDFLPWLNKQQTNDIINWKQLAHPTLYVPISKKLSQVFKVFQEHKTHFAIAVDEYGGTEGIVTMDDVITKLVGDIRDEKTESRETLYYEIQKGIYLLDAKIDIDEVDKALGTQLSTKEDEFETIGGLVYYLTEKLPYVGEQVTYKGVTLTVQSLKNKRIKRVKLALNTSK